MKHGRHSAYLPEQLLAGYARQRRDADLTSLRDEIALVDSMIFEALEAMSGADSPTGWLQLRRLWREMQHANDAGDLRRAGEKISAIGALIERGASDLDQRSDVLFLIERRRRLIDSQSRREVTERMMISYEDAAHLFRELSEAVRETVHDRDQLAEIGRRWEELTGTLHDFSEN